MFFRAVRTVAFRLDVVDLILLEKDQQAGLALNRESAESQFGIHASLPALPNTTERSLGI